MPAFDNLWWRQKGLVVGLWAFFVVCTFLMVKSSGDPLVAPLRGTAWESALSQFATGNQIIFDSSAGINVSLCIYVLVVWLPERGKRARVRRNLQLQYDVFKEECLHIYLSALKDEHGDPPGDLNDRVQFRDFFKGPSSTQGQTRWDAVLNGLRECHLKRLAIEFEILMTEVQFTLTTIDVDNHEAFAFLKRLYHELHRIKYVSPDYDDVKQLSRFLWSVHTGWSFAEGYPDKDVIVQIIESI